MRVTISEYTIPDGDAGILRTVEAMGGLMRAGAATPMVHACAADVTAGACNAYEALAALRAWLRERWTFVLDPDLPGMLYDRPGEYPRELLTAADTQLERIRDTGTMVGDCDCAAILLGALALAIHCEVRILCAGFGLDNVPAYVHTWCEARPFGGEAFLELDITRGSPALNGEAITRAAEWSVN